MKYSVVVMPLLGLCSASEARRTDLVQIIEAQGMTAAAASDSESSDSESDEENVQLGWNLKGDQGIIDALTPQKGNCEERLWLSADEMAWQMDQFSRKFDKTNYNNAAEIADELGLKLPKVHTYELIDKAFSFPRVRRYEDVQENMTMLEHFQDNLNTNISNQVNVDRFIRVGKAVVASLNEKYHNGEFADPANTDPREVQRAEEEG
jgi:hypothetical protein